MAGGRLYGAATSNLGTLFQSQRVPSVSQPLDPFLLSGSSSSSPPPFLGSRSMMSFEDVNRGGGGGNGLKRSIIFPFDQDEYGDEDLDGYFHQPEKKRRLSAAQVQSLEKHFNLDNKLEPERKVQLAKDLGLQPRQVAIWFQNRRARWKTKQLEKDYGVLQASFDSLKADFDILVKEHDQLKSEVNLLTDKLLHEEKERGSSGLSDANNLFVEPPQIPIMDSVSEDEVSKNSVVACKPEDISSTRSDTLDSDSSHNTDVGHSSLLEHGDHSSHGFGPDHSDSSHDEDDNTLLPQYIFPKLEEADYSDPPSNSCNYGFPAEDDAFWSWSY